MASEKTYSLRTKTSMQPVPIVKPRDDESGLKTLRYEEVQEGRQPIPVTVPPPRIPPTDTHPALREPALSLADEDSAKRDSGLAPMTSTNMREGSVISIGSASKKTVAITNTDATTTATATANTNNATLPSTAPATPVVAERSSSWSSNATNKLRKTNGGKKNASPDTPESADNRTTSEDNFSPLMTPIPTDAQLELDFMDQVTFSNRGSVLLGGKKAVNAQLRTNPNANICRRKASISMLEQSDIKLLSAEVELESQKVRSMYEISGPLEWEKGSPSIMEQLQQSAPNDRLREPSPSPAGRNVSSGSSLRPDAFDSNRGSTVGPRTEHELAGGVEDWEDVSGEDVDRYGFITAKKELSRSGTPEPRAPQRVSTMLQLASETPRKKRGLGRSVSNAKSNRSTPQRAPSRKASARSLNTAGTSLTQRSPSKSFRQARNRLPGNADRRWMEEAGDMLTLPPGLADIAEEEDSGYAAADVKKRESSRTEKWRKMAKVVKAGTAGEGMVFEFDTKSPKLIERTWKGIPDRWRAAAWHSFLTSSARKVEGSPTDPEIIASFHQLLKKSSADDVQIDMDVPRTINSHIMFRRRYRGGQRLLFRVLHSLSLYFPVTGYVQGMASLAATLLCYYDEETCFVMLVRMWTLRSLDKLYAPGFGGLMAALDEFQKGWMNGHDVSRRLDEHGVDPTAYGTRWYLTLFNYSIPFPAQLRVWDVFMLLGDADPSVPTTPERPFAGGLDILHSASCALIDGTREILLDSDFENSMKVLTSWVPIKDEELFMKVAKAEWKLHHGKKLKT